MLISSVNYFVTEEKMRRVVTINAPQPAGHYSQAMVYNGIVYISGQLPIVPETGEKIFGPIEEQTAQVMRNLAAILKAAKSDLKRVLKTTVYVSDISLWDKVNAVYKEFFGSHRPARAVVPTRELHYGFQIEIEAIAAVQVSEKSH
jgi:2-iminobutanoate/2-iminopropanoate deaminase